MKVAIALLVLVLAWAGFESWGGREAGPPDRGSDIAQAAPAQAPAASKPPLAAKATEGRLPETTTEFSARDAEHAAQFNAGYDWGRLHAGTDPKNCPSRSDSFFLGCSAAVEDTVQEKSGASDCDLWCDLFDPYDEE